MSFMKSQYQIRWTYAKKNVAFKKKSFALIHLFFFCKRDLHVSWGLSGIIHLLRIIRS